MQNLFKLTDSYIEIITVGGFEFNTHPTRRDKNTQLHEKGNKAGNSDDRNNVDTQNGSDKDRGK